jgi:hypothetical protein
MIRIVAPHFVAGVILEDGHVTKTAPIVAYMYGWDEDLVRFYCAKQGWQAEVTE